MLCAMRESCLELNVMWRPPLFVTTFAFGVFAPLLAFGADGEKCLAELAIEQMNAASSEISQRTADDIYGIGDIHDAGSSGGGGSGSGSDGREGWSSPDIAGCVGDIGLDFSIGLPGLPDVPDIPDVPELPELDIGTVCGMVGDRISRGLAGWSEMTKDNEFLGRARISVEVEMTDAE